MKAKFILLSIIALIFINLSSCSSCSRQRRHEGGSGTKTAHSGSATGKAGKTVIKMQKQGGVYQVPCKINGTEMTFIFDTGASDITMSLTEAVFLYKQGRLKDEDFLGTEHYRIANGNVEEGTVINLRTVSIGSKTLRNVRASIVHNNSAPLLLGQSALAKFGKISIDYKRNEITLE